MSDEKCLVKDETCKQPKSINNRLIVEPYKKEGLKATVTNGFAMVTQKVSLKGLLVLMDAEINLPNGGYMRVRPGDTVYIKEELLHTQQWAQKIYQSDAIQGDFMIIESTYVDFVVSK